MMFESFSPLEQADFQALTHAGYLKGLLKPFKGKGSLELWASQCLSLRDQLIALAQRQILPQVKGQPMQRLPAQLAQQTTGAGTTFLRWRNVDRSRMGVALWNDVISDPATPSTLLSDLYALEQQRLVLNMQISLTHSLARAATECARRMDAAEAHYQRRLSVHRFPSITQQPRKELS